MVKVVYMLMVAMGLFSAVSPSFAQVSNVNVASENTDIRTTSTAKTTASASVLGFGGNISRGGSATANVGSVVIANGVKAENISVASKNSNVRTTNAEANVGSVVVK